VEWCDVYACCETTDGSETPQFATKPHAANEIIKCNCLQTIIR